jgi:acetyltransferase-like isoleucine patch superfamily enzyme
LKAHLGQTTWLRIKRTISHLWGPRMVGGWVRGDGEYLAHTRISNQSCIFEPQKLQVDDHVFIGHFSVLDATYGLTIGEGCQIGFFTGIFTHSSHVAIRLYGRAYVATPEKAAYFTAAVKLGPYCFIGAHATILPGTTLGKGCLVSAYSLVKGEFEDYSVIAGNPAKRVGDTREMDAPHLQRHPDLKLHYEQWAQGGGND